MSNVFYATVAQRIRLSVVLKCGSAVSIGCLLSVFSRPVRHGAASLTYAVRHIPGRAKPPFVALPM